MDEVYDTTSTLKKDKTSSSTGGTSSDELANSALMMKKKKELPENPGMANVVDDAVYSEKHDGKAKPKTKQWGALRNDLLLMKAGKKTASKIGATLAKRMGSAKADDLWNEIEGLKKEGGHKEEIAKLEIELAKANKVGDKYTKLIGGPESFMAKEEIDEHLEEFKKGGAHSFITAFHHKGFSGQWGGWGKENDRNFVAPLPTANKIVDKAKSKGGIRALETALGIPEWSWVDKCPEGIIYRYIIPANKVKEAGLEMARGFEGSAYAKEWIAGGRTEGGEKEAVIKTFRGKEGEDFKNAILSGIIKVVPLDLSKETPLKPGKKKVSETEKA